MPLALGTCEVFFTSDLERFLDDVDRTARLALLDLAEDAATAIARDPETPEDTGALKDSIRVAPPGYNQDDSPLTVRAGSAGNFFSLNSDSTRARPATRDQALDAHRGAQLAAGASGAGFSGDVDELVLPTATGYATWLGSFLKYSFYVHQGYYNVLAGRELAGRPYITRVAMPFLAGEYPEYFRKRWLQVRYRGA